MASKPAVAVLDADPSPHPDDLPATAVHLQRVLGQSLTAIAVDVDDASLVEAWADARQAPPPAQAARLRTTLLVVSALAEAEPPDVIRAWFVGQNPELGDIAPALRIAVDPDPEPLLRAARTFLAHG